MMGESETSEPYKKPKGTTLLSILKPGFQTSLWRNPNEPETLARKLEGRLKGRTEAELSDYEFFTKNWYKKDWRELALSGRKAYEPQHLETILSTYCISPPTSQVW